MKVILPVMSSMDNANSNVVICIVVDVLCRVRAIVIVVVVVVVMMIINGGDDNYD